jgi:xanthine/CO dehydrogenase XdhC/CoxF family maturation factor
MPEEPKPEKKKTTAPRRIPKLTEEEEDEALERLYAEIGKPIRDRFPKEGR